MEEETSTIEVDESKALTPNHLVFHSFADAMVVAEKLLSENYCVMLSTEEQLIILNYVEVVEDGWAARNYVVFNSRYELNKDWY